MADTIGQLPHALHLFELPSADHTQNRKLRHLHGISLRNLSLAQPPSHPRGRTIDDEALPYTLKSPAKALALRETNKLGHSRSSADLRAIQEFAIDGSADAEGGDKGTARGLEGRDKGTARPPFARLRRRSTMDWSGASPQQRQQKLENVVTNRMADCFFSVHVADVKEPAYVSEIAEKTMNPTFRQFDLGSSGPAVTREDELTVKFWVKSEKMEQFQHLLDMSLCLRSLQYIGKTLDQFRYPLPTNAVIFHLTDGVYTCFTNVTSKEPEDPFSRPAPKSSTHQNLPCSSFDALLRLSKLDDSIQDALATRDRLASDLEAIRKANEMSLSEEAQVEEKMDHLKTVDYAVATVEKQLATARRKCDEKSAGLHARWEYIRKDREAQAKSKMSLPPEQARLPAMETSLSSIRDAITAQRRRICSDLQTIFPMDIIPNKPLAFTIHSLHLPDSEELDSVSPDSLAAALGYVAQATQLLAFYLTVAIPYPLSPRASTSTIFDPISTSLGAESAARTFPLYIKGAIRFRLEYAVFLLNKDIEIILSDRFGVRVLDIRQTLPNLKYAFYMATAGDGELPARKAGGVRGLLKVGRPGGQSMPADSGPPSRDSTTTVGWSGTRALKDAAGRITVSSNGDAALESLKRNQKAQESKLMDG
ncbi:hypothetical protein LTR66_001406 [Elasticomyces elasticus]|nr:hypothetical protein LTR66_001406 [Elasticomyces elasticus]